MDKRLFNTWDELILAVKNGDKVYWANENYQVVYDVETDQYLIKWGYTHYVGLRMPLYRLCDFFSIVLLHECY